MTCALCTVAEVRTAAGNLGSSVMSDVDVQSQVLTEDLFQQQRKEASTDGPVHAG